MIEEQVTDCKDSETEVLEFEHTGNMTDPMQLL